MNPIISTESETHSFIKLLNEREVALLIRKSVHWLRRKRWEGGIHSIPYLKLGGSVRYVETEVLNWIAQHRPQTSTSMDKPHKTIECNY